jgi:ABC-type spermidine/putrescine transport system permease subunit II
MGAVAGEEAPHRRPTFSGLRVGPVALSAPAVLGLLLFFVAPIAAFFVYSFLTTGLFRVSGPLTLQAYREAVTSGLNGTLAVNSFIIGFSTAAASLLIALPVAYWLRFAAGRWQTLVLFLVAATFFASYLVRIYAWRSILGENGLLNTGLREMGLIDEPLKFLVFNRFSVTVALVHIFLPYVVLVLYAGFRALSPELLEASQDLGASASKRWRKILLPLIAAPAATSFLFVFILSSSDPVTAQFLGGTEGAMLGVRVREMLVATGNWPLGAALAFLMLAAFAVCYGITALGLRLLGLHRVRFADAGSGGAERRSVPALVVTLAALVFLYLPLVMVVLFSFHKTGGLSFPFKGFSTRWYEEVFNSDEFRRSLENSAVVATVTSAITLVLGTAAAYGLTRVSPFMRAPLAALFFVPLTLPGLFLGISLLTYFARLDLQLSLRTVIIAHVVYVFPYFLLIAKATLDRVDWTLEESAADLGASPVTTFRRVTLPQIWPLLVGATVLAFALSFDEFIITFFVIGADSTLPMYIWSSLRRTVDPSINVISTVLMVVTILLWVIAFVVVFRSERRRRRSLMAAGA